jgi:MYXO-CTERM domain-containing protein
VQFFYRFAADGLNWGAWTAIGTDTTSAAWDMGFNFPQGTGHYQFYSVATDNDGNVQPAPLNAQASVVYNPSLQSQTINFGGLSDRALDESPVTIFASASSSLPVVFSSLTPSVCTVSGDTVTLLSTGTCSIAADQSGNATYAPAAQEVRSFSVLLGQSISFAPLSNRALGSGSFALVASSSSGLAVVFSSTTPAVCTVSGNSVTLVAIGTCSIAADQPGNAAYAAAPTVVQSFAVTGAVVEDGDVPLPPWALGLLGAALLGAMSRRHGRTR